MIKKSGVLLLGILALLFCISAVSIYFSQDIYAATWDRRDLRCPDGIHEKTLCIEGGSEQCTAQYCKQVA